MDNDYEIFQGKKFSDLCKDIVRNSDDKRNTIEQLITDLREMIKTVNDAVTLIPLLKEYIDVGVRNDEQLIKLAAIIQRLMAGVANSEDGNPMLTDDEKKQLMATIDEVAKAPPAPPKEPVHPIDKEKAKRAPHTAG